VEHDVKLPVMSWEELKDWSKSLKLSKEPKKNKVDIEIK